MLGVYWITEIAPQHIGESSRFRMRKLHESSLCYRSKINIKVVLKFSFDWMVRQINDIPIVGVTRRLLTPNLSTVHHCQSVVQEESSIEAYYICIRCNYHWRVYFWQHSVPFDLAIRKHIGTYIVLVKKETIIPDCVILGFDVVGDDVGEVAVVAIKYLELASNWGYRVVGGKGDVEIISGEGIGHIMRYYFLNCQRELLEERFGLTERSRSPGDGRGLQDQSQDYKHQFQLVSHIYYRSEFSLID